MFELDVRSRKAIYEQLVDKVKEMIVYGILKPDEAASFRSVIINTAHREPEYNSEGIP